MRSVIENLELLRSRLARFGELRVLCLGDLMLDRFVEGSVHRISPESSVPVLSDTTARSLPGGAANVARNIAALGGICTLVGTVGTDLAADELETLLTGVHLIEAILLRVDDRPTTTKTRFLCNGQQLLRVDNESTVPVSANTEAKLIATVELELGRADVLVVSDYAKGTLTVNVLRAAISAARARGMPVVVDPKCTDLARYAGATVTTPNVREISAATGLTLSNDQDAVIGGRRALELVDTNAVLITRGAIGMTLVPRDGAPSHIPALARHAFDVTGAGDTVVAALALALAAGATLVEAATLSNTAAGIVVGKRGTAVVRPDELLEDFERQQRHHGRIILTQEQALSTTNAWRAAGLTVGLTNGVFDLIHPGHVSLLSFARAHCDRLIVAVNSDESVRRLKGLERPINPEADRAAVVRALGVVDAVVIFEEDTPIDLIKAIRPDVLVKGSDYTEATVVGAEFVRSLGGQVLLAPLVPNKSSSQTIAKAKGRKS